MAESIINLSGSFGASMERKCTIFTHSGTYRIYSKGSYTPTTLKTLPFSVSQYFVFYDMQGGLTTSGTGGKYIDSFINGQFMIYTPSAQQSYGWTDSGGKQHISYINFNSTNITFNALGTYDVMAKLSFFGLAISS